MVRCQMEEVERRRKASRVHESKVNHVQRGGVEVVSGGNDTRRSIACDEHLGLHCP